MTLLMQANSDLQIFIRQELNENLDTRDSYLQDIKEWLRQQPHLPDTWDDVRIMTFLRGCGFSLEKCKKKLDAYFTMKSLAPEFFTNRSFKHPGLQHMSKMVYHVPLPGLTKQGRRVVILRFACKNEYGNVEDSIKLHLMILDLRLLLEKTGITGDVYLLDADTFSSHHFVRLTPTAVKKYFVNVFEVLPLKIKEIHVINIHPLVHTLVSWVKPFLKKKIMDRVKFHPDGIESLHKFIPNDILPEEYGGNAGTLQQINDLWLQKLEENEQWFIEQEQFKSDESKRPGKPFDSGELFGVEGSFKQLTVD